jgi:predicted GNAT family N-acyltransferase
MEVIVVTTEKELNDAFSVRRTVFIDEQHVPEEEEIDQYENDATHVVVYDNEQPVGAGRLRIVDNIGKAERICILSTHRKLGAGKLIMNKIEETAKNKGLSKMKLNAQTHAEKFYMNQGYDTISGVFMDAGIPHVTMIKNI